jgi:hypothetical protein
MEIASRPYRFQNGERGMGDVCQKRAKDAAAIDKNGDGVLQDDELQAWLREKDILKDPSTCKVDVPQIMKDAKVWLQGKALPQADAYHTYAEITEELQHLAADHPDRCQLVSIGKSVEGRDIWALKITSNPQGDTSARPGVVFTGNHHAREWMSMEVPLHLAEELIEKYDTDPDMKRRVDNAEIWVMPTVNPDGYEYSRTEDSWWRKNRDPIVDTGCPPGANACPTRKDGQPVAVGVDINRNYWDGNPDHFQLYRPDGDKPCNTWDDIGVTSDDPGDDTYRGPKGGSEPEVQALMNFEYSRPNIHGIIDHHGYGEMLLRPWGGTETPPDNIKDYDEVGQRMMAAQSNPYRYMSAMDLYPTTGTSTDMHQANGKYAFTIELGQSFQPPPSQFDELKKNVGAADYAFLDWILERYSTPPPAPEPPPAPAPEPPAPAPEPPAPGPEPPAPPCPTPDPPSA